MDPKIATLLWKICVLKSKIQVYVPVMFVVPSEFLDIKNIYIHG
jgi:hypothetical protein